MSISKTQRILREQYSGFGVAKTLLPHHFRVEIPRAPRSSVAIIEDYGLDGNDNSPYEENRVLVPRINWTIMADAAAKDFNQRLRECGLPSGKWHTGSGRDAVKVDRLLGKELCVLAWAAETAKKEQMSAITSRWLALRPHERWWLFSMTVAESGTENDTQKGWRRALYCALSDSPEESKKRKQRPKTDDTASETLSIFNTTGIA